MGRSLGGLMLIAAAVLSAVAIGSWWLERVAFTPSNDSNVAYSILGDEEIRGQVATVVAGATAPTLQQSAAQLREEIERIARIPDGAALMRDIVDGAHSRLIGDSDERVVITAQEQVNIVRNELVGDQAPLTLPVQRVGSVAFVDDWIGWAALSLFGLGVLAALVGLAMRPERGEGTYALGVFFGSLAASMAILGYIVPLLVLPALADDPWMGVFSRLANHQRNLTLATAGVAAVIAVLIVGRSGARNDRRQHSTPLNVGRYRDDRSWSR